MRKLFLIGLAFVSVPAFAQIQLRPCNGTVTSSWNKCVGSVNNPNGSKYVGSFSSSYYSGQGTYTAPDGSKHVGEFISNRKNGQGSS